MVPLSLIVAMLLLMNVASDECEIASAILLKKICEEEMTSPFGDSNEEKRGRDSRFFEPRRRQARSGPGC